MNLLYLKSSQNYIINNTNFSEKNQTKIKNNMFAIYGRGSMYVIMSFALASLLYFFFCRINVFETSGGATSILVADLIVGIIGLFLMKYFQQSDYIEGGHKIYVIMLLIIEAFLLSISLLIVELKYIEIIRCFCVSVLIYLFFILFVYFYRDSIIQANFLITMRNIFILLIFIWIMLLLIYLILIFAAPQYIKNLDIIMLIIAAAITCIIIIFSCIRVYMISGTLDFSKDKEFIDFKIDQSSVMFVAVFFDLFRIILNIAKHMKKRN